MKNIVKFFGLIIPLFILSFVNSPAQEKKFGLVIHGGAGRILKSNMSPERETEYTNTLTRVLEAGYKILSEGGTSLDAVQTVIRMMEDSPLFNAGKGAVLTEKGVAELDASVMDGKTLAAGAVAGIKHVKSPITLARLVMEKSPHVMLIGDGAEEFAKENNLEMVENSYFITKERWESYQKTINRREEAKKIEKHGTVGAVALDMEGNIAAGTSTGGMMMKKFGRVGDAPIIGAGTYADNRTCGVSATGSGEYFIRIGVAKDISSLMQYKGMDLLSASAEAIKKVGDLGGAGGVICLDKDGNVAMPFNTEGMYRGYYMSGNPPVVKIYND
ncbi:MAG TPA: isoaspartyl peptidase/L-asparaginase [Melioribacteraceae bacterium]|nr:isoaspartyl peptidase/L-asparaginase [Melioribacteraceae bacterium]